MPEWSKGVVLSTTSRTTAQVQTLLISYRKRGVRNINVFVTFSCLTNTRTLSRIYAPLAQLVRALYLYRPVY